MKKVAVYANLDKRGAVEALDKLVRWLRRRKIHVRATKGAAGAVPKATELADEDELLDGSELLIVLGGDGTLLSAARLCYPTKVPFLGINFGNLGFLTATGIGDMYASIEAVLAGRYRLQPRILLRARILDPDGTEVDAAYGLNDMVVRDQSGRSLDMEMGIEGTNLGRFRGDGIIVSTPTGSTAYNLSAGGPILEPSLQALMATAICPHSFAVRPLLFPAQQTLEIGCKTRGNRVQVVVDGQLMLDLGTEQKIHVRRAQRPINFILVENRSFYEVLRSKLRWGGA